MLQPAFQEADAHYASTLAGLTVGDGKPVHSIRDCNRNQKFGSALSACQILLLLLKIRPQVVVTTGALPGLLALFFAKKLGAKTIWIDSIANAEEMSLAGQKAREYADVWLSQWPEVAADNGASYAGAVF